MTVINPRTGKDIVGDYIVLGYADKTYAWHARQEPESLLQIGDRIMIRRENEDAPESRSGRSELLRVYRIQRSGSCEKEFTLIFTCSDYLIWSYLNVLSGGWGRCYIGSEDDFDAILEGVPIEDILV